MAVRSSGPLPALYRSADPVQPYPFGVYFEERGTPTSGDFVQADSLDEARRSAMLLRAQGYCGIILIMRDNITHRQENGVTVWSYAIRFLQEL